jgi:general secretion pathway protein J
MTRRADAGFTLIEVLVALALFAMIAGAGLSVLDQVLRTQRSTETRLAYLGDLQRVMHLLTLDLSQAAIGSVTGGEQGLTLDRNGADGALRVTYDVAGGAFARAVARNRGTDTARQPLLSDVVAAEWQFLDDRGAWTPAWPQAAGDGERIGLRAVAITLRLARGDEQIRRVVAVPYGDVP